MWKCAYTIVPKTTISKTKQIIGNVYQIARAWPIDLSTIFRWSVFKIAQMVLLPTPMELAWQSVPPTATVILSLISVILLVLVITSLIPPRRCVYLYVLMDILEIRLPVIIVIRLVQLLRNLEILWPGYVWIRAVVLLLTYLLIASPVSVSQIVLKVRTNLEIPVQMLVCQTALGIPPLAISHIVIPLPKTVSLHVLPTLHLTDTTEV